jgi:hypothetical protein
LLHALLHLARLRLRVGAGPVAVSLFGDLKARWTVGTFFARALDVKNDERAFRAGVNGEEPVGAREAWLAWLAPDPGRQERRDIDHLLIGPVGRRDDCGAGAPTSVVSA